MVSRSPCGRPVTSEAQTEATASSSASAATARVTRPISAASAPVNTSPPRQVSAAAREVSRGSTVSEITAGARPSFTSVSANVVSSAAIAMSEAATMPMPPARTAPCSRVTTGLLSATIWRCMATIARAPSSMPSPEASDRSAPEQNTLPSARITTTFTSSSASAASRCANSSVTSCRDSALRLCGESRVIVATRSATAWWTSSVGASDMRVILP